jgi:predicted nucleotidyltransferase
MKKVDIENKDKLDKIFKEYGVKKAAVFGSIARGEAKKSSDIDILVEFIGEKSLLDLVGLKFALEKILKRKVDITTYNALHPLLRDSILKDQILIF